MHVVVAEDDRIQRERVTRLIARLRPEWTQVAQVATTAGVFRAVAELQPDILVLDIHMDERDPRWIRQLPSGLAVVFTTVDASLAAEAFDLCAADYVMKPLRPIRMEQAFDRVEARLRALGHVPRSERGPPLAAVVAARGNDLLVIQTDDICYLQSDHKYTRVVSAMQEGLVRTSIAEFERRLDPRYFRRIHRGTLLNLRMTQRIWRDEAGKLRVRMRCPGSDLQVSKPYESVFKVL
ncbi:LytTR family DNA-binding domain-containing protein [Xylophilus sp. GOD-11R]|uniref:LytR/AlgR family response regulator transcription factor n=1 Tax=Xylophilus sp. GOD-11R TaxID=3089814 RepID=UPI00298C5EDA|nr:LytTR family DNA-binding domain-containing protein [Xylophilus sp. GOD-11R]WPB56998.1 LytTR family DNA-binding domain-containing protein [Xylophilus sp. GOD-11R]